MELLAIILFVNIMLSLFRDSFNLQYSYNKLSCGIFGMSLKPNASRQKALQKFKILGLYNEDRGKDATGIFVNGEIFKGIGATSEFSDFIEINTLQAPQKNGVMLGHTRQGSWGYKKTLDEAHPFLINEDMVFTHNGTIKNVKELSDKYRKILSEYTVDSQLLGTILDEDGTDVLEDYVGAAALAYTYLSTPNVLYLYHGKSKNFTHSTPDEERPLFYMETKDGVYYSSLACALYAIRDSDKDIPYVLDHNAIFRVENGEILLDDIKEIFREETNVTVPVITTYSGKRHQTPMTTSHGSSTYNRSSGGVSTNNENFTKRETLPIKVIECQGKLDMIYWHMGRYWSTPRKLLQGPIFIRKGGFFGTHDDNTSVLEFFWAGVMLKDKNSYDELYGLSTNLMTRNWVRFPQEHHFAMMVSKYSKYPVTTINLEALNLGDFFRSQWYKNGEVCKLDNYTPKYSDGRNYKVEDGKLTRITSSKREKVLYDSENDFDEEVKALIDGNLLKRISGGSSQQEIFPVPRITTENEKELVWFFDYIPTTTVELEEMMGEAEKDALRKFITIVFKDMWNLDATIPEVEGEMETMIIDAVKGNCSIMDNIKDRMDKQLLEKCYEEILTERAKEHHNKSDFYIETIDEDMNREEAVEKIQEGINELENMQNVSFELMEDEDNDMAQDCANQLLTGTMSTLANLEATLVRYNEPDLVRRVKKIRETKRQKDGAI